MCLRLIRYASIVTSAKMYVTSARGCVTLLSAKVTLYAADTDISMYLCVLFLNFNLVKKSIAKSKLHKILNVKSQKC